MANTRSERDILQRLIRLPKVSNIPLDQQVAEIDRRLFLLYDERRENGKPVTPSHIASALGLHKETLRRWRSWNGENEGEDDLSLKRERSEAIELWVERFDALCQDSMTDKQFYQSTIYLLKSIYGHFDTPEQAKENVTLSFDLIKDDVAKAKAEFAGSGTFFIAIGNGVNGSAKSTVDEEAIDIDFKEFGGS